MNKQCLFSEKLSLYIDGELTEEESKTVRSHLQACVLCKNELSRLQSVNNMILGIRNIEPSPQFERAFWKKINSIKEKKEKRWSAQNIVLWWLRPSFVAAAVVAVIALGLILNVKKEMPKPNPIELAISEDLQFYRDLDIVSRLDMLENWDAITAESKRN